ncbi:caspase activity and apoptosis inhibitor 1 isoform X2 [Scleropages formosus]|uniref:Caspase activity and apoptosis inhibitor 1 n=1 Tax=Scleropages formosus TaxID=113540 RepID=A0A8C9U357_SCLFO|nr:caspase activity and apoptosis inhibitor 1 isoform X2 [Scleropages formosus]
MAGKKSGKEKKRRHSRADAGRGGAEGERKRRNTESSLEPDSKEDGENRAVDEPSDIEEGGLDLNVPFKPISAYMSDRQEMLEQCFRVLGENKLRKMLPDELKDCTFTEIKKLCWEQLEQLAQSQLLQILEGEEVNVFSDAEEEGHKRRTETDSQQDNNVDSTSSLKENMEMEDLKQVGGGSGEESDVLSINADTYDSDIEGPKEEPVHRSVPAAPEPDAPKPLDPKKELQKDIEKSVSEILALGASPNQEQTDVLVPPLSLAAVSPSAPLSGPPPTSALPSAQQLELLELEMRARAIKALMKANEVKKQVCN